MTRGVTEKRSQQVSELLGKQCPPEWDSSNKKLRELPGKMGVINRMC